MEKNNFLVAFSGNYIYIKVYCFPQIYPQQENIMAAAKVNASLWNSLSEEEKNKIIQHFSYDTDYDIESIEPDQNVPIPNPKTLIYGASEGEVRKLTEDELIVKLKMDTKKSDKVSSCIDNFDGRAFLLCVSIIAQENINSSVSEEDDLINYSDIASEISDRPLKAKEHNGVIYEMSIGDVAFLKLFSAFEPVLEQLPVFDIKNESDSPSDHPEGCPSDHSPPYIILDSPSYHSDHPEGSPQMAMARVHSHSAAMMPAAIMRAYSAPSYPYRRSCSPFRCKYFPGYNPPCGGSILECGIR
jgi:hypothetical protein